MSLDQDRAIAQMLPEAWDAFFARFGRLTEVQRQAIPAVLAGDDALICSATASGKTEAVCAPLVQRFLPSLRPWIVLYVSPTRALINDLYQRLQTPIGALGKQLSRRTGEYSEAFDVIPNVLLTTPESLDSMLCRGVKQGALGHPLAHVRAVVLDEIHLLHGSARGEQVRWLLERLRRLREHAQREQWTRTSSLQVVALSATVPDIDGIRAAYTPAGRTIKVAGRREIRRAHTSEMAPIKSALPQCLAEEDAPKKVLVFCNARKRVDELTTDLQRLLAPLNYVVSAHHGSLAKAVREDSEEAMRTAERAVIVTTSTLEIGIDIGDVDLVALDAPAPDVAALLQRIGRGNRRTNFTTVLAAAKDDKERLIHEAMLAAAEQGWLGDDMPGPQYAVGLQQIASYIYQAPRRARSVELLTQFLNTVHPDGTGLRILEGMREKQEIILEPEGYRLGPELLEQCDAGKLHSNIEGTPGATVVDQNTGKQYAKGIEFGSGRRMSLGGFHLDVRSNSGFKIEATRGSGGPDASNWRYAAKSFFLGAGQPQAVRAHLGFAKNVWPAYFDGEDTTIFHFGGSKRRAVLELIVASNPRALGVAVDPWSLTVPGPLFNTPDWLVSAHPATLEIALANRLDTLERVLARPRANKRLPVDLRVREVREWLELDKECALYSIVTLANENNSITALSAL